jgi:formylglycine-generating enzyme required for sulfatase activity
VWQSAERGNTAEDYDEYLRQYPQGKFAGLARNRLARLRPAVLKPPKGNPSPGANTTPSVRMSVTGVPLVALTPFTTVKVDDKGIEIERKTNQECWGYVEDLGNGVKLELVEIPVGEFEMGSNDGDDDEKPVPPVRLSGFLMGRYEVTQAQWRAVARR